MTQAHFDVSGALSALFAPALAAGVTALGMLGLEGRRNRAGAARTRVEIAKTEADITAVSVDTLTDVIGELRQENARHLASIDKLREDGHSIRNRLQKLLAFVQLIVRHLERLEVIIRGLGEEPPPRPDMSPLSE